MALFLCRWPDRVSLLVDDMHEAAARQVARETAEGVEPTQVVGPFAPRAFVAELVAGYVVGDDESAEGDAELLLAPSEHTAELLDRLDDGDPPSEDVLGDEDDEDDAAAECGAEADGEDQGVIWCCTLPRGHEGQHESRDGGRLCASWADA